MRGSHRLKEVKESKMPSGHFLMRFIESAAISLIKILNDGGIIFNILVSSTSQQA